MAGVKALLDEVGPEDAGEILAGKMKPPLEGSFGPLKGERVKKAALAMDAATARLNAAIDSAEKKLFAMNLGVTAEVPFDSESDNEHGHWQTFLRFGKDGRDWRLLVTLWMSETRRRKATPQLLQANPGQFPEGPTGLVRGGRRAGGAGGRAARRGSRGRSCARWGRSEGCVRPRRGSGSWSCSLAARTSDLRDRRGPRLLHHGLAHHEPPLWY